MMRAFALWALMLVALGVAVDAARLVPDDAFDVATGGMRVSAQTALLRMFERRKDKEDEESARAYSTIKFIVPPHHADEFEDEWMELDHSVQDERDNEIHTLKSQKLDNLVYVSYGEWKTLHGLHKHLTSNHFGRFSDFVDDRGITWFLELLKNESEDVEEASRHRRKVSELSHTALAMAPSQDPAALRQLHADLQRHKQLAHVLVKYFVPPGEDEDFIDAWTDAAESTIKEKGNRIYSLRKVAFDNVRFYTYGSWERMGDFLDHWDSHHVQKFKDFLADRNIVWSVEPLEAVGGEKGKR